MRSEISSAYKSNQEELRNFINNFDKSGEVYGDQPRNTLKLFKLGEETVNIKSFKVPNLINKIAYRFFRKSKAQRSYEYGNMLIDRGINTPKPIAYFQESSGLFFGKSYYISRHLNYDLTYRELIHDKKFPGYNNILKAFTHFTFKLHEEGVEFLDHSPGNTLIVINDNNDYDFYLVDLNRMVFHDTALDYETRIKNFSRLWSDKYMVLEMAREYAKLIDKNYEVVYKDMWQATQDFRIKHQRKKRLKNKIRKRG